MHESMQWMTVVKGGKKQEEQARDISVAVRANVISVVVRTNDFLSCRYECRRDKDTWTILGENGKLVQVFYGLDVPFPNVHLVGMVVAAACKEEEDRGRFLK